MSPDPDLSHTVTVLLAGGEGRRMHELTARQCKPALHFLAEHRIVDFAMASVVRSGLPRLMVATQYSPATLTRHLHSVWGTAFAPGALTCAWGPEVAGPGGYAGTADVLRANAAALDAMGAREVLVLAADHVYAMDYRPLIATHRAAGAPLTVAAMAVPLEEASRFGILAAGADGRIASFAEKPDFPVPITGDPAQALASLGIYVIDWAWAKARLADGRVADFGEDLIPLAVAQGEAAVWRWQGYWRDVGTLDSYRRAWLDFETRPMPCPRPVAPGVALHLPPQVPERFAGRVRMGDLRLFSPHLGAEDRDRWTVLDRSVLMPGARVAPGVRLSRVIVAPGTAIPEGLAIGEDAAEDARWFRISGDTTLVTSAMLAKRSVMRVPLVPAFGLRARTSA